MTSRRGSPRRGSVESACLLALAAALCGAPGDASAQTAKTPFEAAKDKDQARKLADEGQVLFERGDYRGALRKLAEAHARFAAPTIELAQAEAHEKLGELREAQAIYRRLSQAKIADSAPPEFRDAQKDAAVAAERLEKVIPKVLLVLVGQAPPVLTLTLDGAALEGEIWGTAVALDPGEHTLVIEMSGRAPETRSLALKEGETKRVEIRGISGVAGRPAPAQEKGSGRSFAAPGVAFGIGGAGLLVGGIAGGLALAKMGSFREACGAELRCPGRLEGEVAGARLAGHSSTIGFAVAGVGAVMGTVLLVWPVGGDKGSSGDGDKGSSGGHDKASSGHEDKVSPAVSLGVNPIGFSVTGRF